MKANRVVFSRDGGRSYEVRQSAPSYPTSALVTICVVYVVAPEGEVTECVWNRAARCYVQTVNS